MNLQAELAYRLPGLITKAAYVICIAIVFEFIAWWLGRRIEKLTTPFITQDATREASWRVRRRAVLRQTPKIISRTICYTIAVILVFDVFGVPVLPLSLAVGAVVALFGAAAMPLLRDTTQGYFLLAEDALAVGDVVDIEGHRGIVEKLTLRGTWLRDEQGQTHILSNRDITNVVVHRRRQEKQEKSGAHPNDPEAPPTKPQRATPRN